MTPPSDGSERIGAHAAVMQLALDGIEPTKLTGSPRAGFTAAQRAILLRVRSGGGISSSDAGRIVHLHREPACRHCREGGCLFAASDGGDAMKRLSARGLVKRARKGWWVMT